MKNPFARPAPASPPPALDEAEAKKVIFESLMMSRGASEHLLPTLKVCLSFCQIFSLRPRFLQPGKPRCSSERFHILPPNKAALVAHSRSTLSIVSLHMCIPACPPCPPFSRILPRHQLDKDNQEMHSLRKTIIAALTEGDARALITARRFDHKVRLPYGNAFHMNERQERIFSRVQVR